MLLSCTTTINFNIKVTREEISKAIAQDNKEILRDVTYVEAHEENEEGLLPIEEAILKEKIEAIAILLERIYFDDTKRVVSKSVQINSVEVYKILKENELISFCLKIAKENNNIIAISKILEAMEATELEREILLGTKESVKLKLEEELKEGNESILAVSEENIFEIIKERANGKVFLECVKLEYYEKILRFAEKVEIKERTKKGLTALMIASVHGHKEIVSLLLEKGVQLDEKDEDGDVALIHASYHGHEGVVSLLLQAGAKVDEKNKFSWTALMLASQEGHEGVVSLLLKAGANVDECNDYGVKALARAIENGHEGVVSLLLKAGANVDQKDEDGWTALIIASDKGYEGIVSLLLKAKAKVDHKNIRGWTPLMKASYKGYERIVNLLLQEKAKVDEKNRDSFTALMIASQNGHKGVVSLLLQEKAKVDEKSKDGKTAFMLAIQRGHERVAIILLEAGAKVDETDNYGFTALMIASQNACELTITQYLQIVNLLLAQGVNLKVVVEGNFLAYLKKEYVFELLDLGLIDINDINEDGMTNFYSILKGLAKNGTDLVRYKSLVITLLTNYNANRLF